VIAAYERLRVRHPAALARARALAERYEAGLRRLRLRDDHVAATYPTAAVGAYAAGTLSLLLFRLPFAALGVLLNWLPYRAVALVAARAKNRDLPATYKLLGGFALFPLAWILEALAAGWLAGAPWGACVLVLAPLTGYVAMLFQERYEHFLAETAAYLRRALRRRSLRALRAEREALRAELDALASLDRPDPD
jgi:hypothetical protein